MKIEQFLNHFQPFLRIIENCLEFQTIFIVFFLFIYIFFWYFKRRLWKYNNFKVSLNDFHKYLIILRSVSNHLYLILIKFFDIFSVFFANLTIFLYCKQFVRYFDQFLTIFMKLEQFFRISNRFYDILCNISKNF